MLLEKKTFWPYLNFTQQNLIKQSFYLLAWAEKNKDKLHDYAFIVMPSAKAFEGYLKKLFFDLEFISEREFSDDYFRIGMALNPELEKVKHLKKECLYDEITKECGEDTASLLWKTWKKCRNRLFHYFPNEQHTFTLKESRQRLYRIIKAVEASFLSCNLKKGGAV
jgi:hypothetical protein